MMGSLGILGRILNDFLDLRDAKFNLSSELSQEKGNDCFFLSL